MFGTRSRTTPRTARPTRPNSLLTDATRARIFDLAAQAHYFSGKIDSGNRKLAFTGAKKLIYKDGQRESTAAYNYSSLPAVQQLTTLFQSIAATLEFGRRLAHYHRYQKLALDDELKRMEDQTRLGELVELQAVRPVLQEIHDDGSVINVVRARAQRIMDSMPRPHINQEPLRGKRGSHNSLPLRPASVINCRLPSPQPTVRSLKSSARDYPAQLEEAKSPFWVCDSAK